MLTKREFEQLQQRLVSAWHRGDLNQAYAEIETVLREGTSEMKGQSLFYRGMIRESEGSLEDAKQNWLDGLQYAHEGTFLRYQLEHGIGEADERSEKPSQALTWYRTALKTCSDGEKFSGNQTLAAFLRLTGRNISRDDYPLLASVVEKSWQVLGLSGKPDLKDLPSSIDALGAKFMEMVENARETHE